MLFFGKCLCGVVCVLCMWIFFRTVSIFSIPPLFKIVMKELSLFFFLNYKYKFIYFFSLLSPFKYSLPRNFGVLLCSRDPPFTKSSCHDRY